jgi:hypothetical protein
MGASVLLWFLPAAAVAQGGPPMITDDPFTVGSNNWEINLLPTMERSRGTAVFEAPNVDINYGVGDRIQLKFEVPLIIRKDDGQPAIGGVGNTGIGVRYRFIDESKHGFAMSTYPAFEFNNRTNSVRRGLADAGHRLFIPVEIARTVKGFGINAEAGYLIEQYGGNSWEYGFLFGRDVSDRFEALGEIHGASPENFSASDLVLNVGSRVAMSDRLTVLMSVGRSLVNADASPATIAALGVQLTFRHTPEHEQ